MRILIYEFVTGGGCYLLDSQPTPYGSLLAEGRAMRDALAADFHQVADTEVCLLHDVRLPQPQATSGHYYELSKVDSAEEHESKLMRAALSADATVLIAPEFDGHLLNMARALEGAGVKLLSPAVEFTEIAADKQATASRLEAADVPVPMGCLTSVDMLQFLPFLHFPSVLKPNDGAGSSQVTLLRSTADIPTDSTAAASWRMEEYIEGTPASVAVLCGSTPLPCPACWQRLSDDGSFQYLGGSRIENPDLARRAQSLALRAIAAMPPTSGYVGVDLVLGAAADGSEDTVIEINPRLTTSYVGIRQLTPDNLAQAMLAAADGRVPQLSWLERTIQFEADGTCLD